ncbi:hypothetical protein Pdw03_0984 [Penicillium digitatum]|uniref:Uncharacterized protein n=1 Tax=Penicillium digitatum TaxID=36651 RepID=A0A7T7BNI4_PENDI|nr:hypothetical protein Pdw03_0984 [Penicillium digitatum]
MRDLLEEESVGGRTNGFFTAEICKLQATNSHIETQLDHARGQLDESLREGHMLHVTVDQLRHKMRVLGVENKKLRDELVETRAGIAGVMQTLNSLQTEGMEIKFDDIEGSETSAIDILSVEGEI